MYEATVNTLVDIITGEYSPKEAIEFLNTLTSEIEIYPTQFIFELRDARYKYGLSQNICPYCGSDETKIDKFNENTDADGNRGEWVTYRICRNCGKEY